MSHNMAKKGLQFSIWCPIYIKQVITIKQQHFVPVQIESIYNIWQYKCYSKIEICYGKGREHYVKSRNCIQNASSDKSIKFWLVGKRKHKTLIQGEMLIFYIISSDILFHLIFFSAIWPLKVFNYFLNNLPPAVISACCNTDTTGKNFCKTMNYFSGICWRQCHNEFNRVFWKSGIAFCANQRK